VVLSEAGSVQHATQQAPEAAAARLRSGAEAPRVKQARRAARRPTLSCAAAGGATLQASRRVGFGTRALAAQLSTPFAKFAHRSNLGGKILAGGWV
jgi:hypothetical protein